jgi:uncharacterized tellurite resistance protein B-like protein
MLDVIKRFFEHNLIPDSSTVTGDPQQAIRLAVAALLVEVAESDYEKSPRERETLLETIRDRFGLDARSSSELIRLAEAEHAESTDYFQFTSLINDHYHPNQKLRIVEDLWRVAFADGQLHNYEEHVIRRLADLIHVSHKDFIAAKHRVIESG